MYDITWCASKCANTRCFRHQVNIRAPSAWRSYSDFNAGGCPDHIQDGDVDVKFKFRLRDVIIKSGLNYK